MSKENYTVVVWVDKNIEVQIGPLPSVQVATEVMSEIAPEVADLVAPKNYYDYETFITRNQEAISSVKVRKHKKKHAKTTGSR